MKKVGVVFFLAIGAMLVVAITRNTADQAMPPSPGLHTAGESADHSQVPLAKTTRSLDYLEQVTVRDRRDFEQMQEKNVVRALVTHSKTFYFFDGATQRGLSYDALREFEKYVNKELKTKTIKMRIVFIPVTRDQLLPALKAER